MVLRPLVCLVLVSAFLSLGSSGPVGASSWNDPIQPGAMVNGSCTLNFVYDGTGALAGDVFIGTAAHCVNNVGDRMRLGGLQFGSVAFIRDGDGAWADDYAFIRIDADRHDDVVASVKGHPTWPSGVITAAETRLGDVVGYSGYGMGFSATPVTREERVGVIQSDNARDYTVQGPEIFGDSGGPIVHHETGAAYGIVSGAQVCCPYANRGPTVEGLLADAAAFGFTLTLRTA